MSSAGATIGDQGSTSIASANEWHGTFTYGLEGAVIGSPAPNWYYDPTSYFNPTAWSISGFGNSDNPYMLSSGASTACSTYPQYKLTPTGAALIRDNKLGFALKSMAADYTYADQLDYAAKQYVYKNLKNNPSDLHIGVGDEPFIAFYDSLATTGIGQFEAVREMLHGKNKNIQQASAMNSAITPSNVIESNRKIVTDIYANKWLAGIHEFTGTDYKTLYDIAKQQPILGGTDAVFGARVMLGLDFNFLNGITNLPLLSKKAISEPFAKAGHLYPNPNNGNMQMSYSLAQGSKGEVFLYSLAGVRINTYALSVGEDNILSINENNLDMGIYFYQVVIDGQAIVKDKIVIIK